VKYAADTVMDLSTGGVNLDEVRTRIINASSVPIAPCRLQALESGCTLDREARRRIDSCTSSRSTAAGKLISQTNHAGLLIEHLPLVKGRLTAL